MLDREKYENGILSIRFIGARLENSGVSIYDLSESLLAIQRIIHKAYLAQNGKLLKGAYPNKEERESLALQLGERKRKSDAFALLPILADPVVQESMKKLMDYVISGVIGYYVGDVLKRVEKEEDQNKKIFIGSIYTEVANIVNRVDTVGGVESISLGAPALDRETVAVFSGQTKDYLASLKDETYLGTYQEIQGKVYKLYPASKIVAIRRAGRATVSIFLKQVDFDSIRYNRDPNQVFLFKGRPIYRFGVETKSVSEFEADEIELVEIDS